MEELRAYLQPQLSRVETLIREALASDVALLDQVNGQLREHPGKMLRPTLALLVAEALGGITADTYRFAAAAELLHNATLLHDDVVDGATERRGIPTVASLLGSSAAVLIGDFWLVKCLHLVLGASRDANCVLDIFAQTLRHLTEGELLQLQMASTGATTEADYLRIVYGKTASLFETAARTAAISVQATPEQVKAASGYARILGQAFQMKDDIFDYSAQAGAVGKPVGIDLQEQKITLPLLCALETVSADAARAVREQVVRIADYPENVAAVQRFVLAHDGVGLACKRMEAYINQALTLLETFPESAAKAHLVRLTRYVADRQL